MSIMHPNNHEKKEWLRIAKSLREFNMNAAAKFVEISASKDKLPLNEFDCIARIYRSWLIDNDFGHNTRPYVKHSELSKEDIDGLNAIANLYL